MRETILRKMSSDGLSYGTPSVERVQRAKRGDTKKKRNTKSDLNDSFLGSYILIIMVAMSSRIYYKFG